VEKHVRIWVEEADGDHVWGDEVEGRHGRGW